MICRAFFQILALSLLLAAANAQAQQYRWIDKDGRVQYSDAPPPPGARDVRRPNVSTAAPTPAPTAAELPFELARLQKDFPVTLYTTPDCKEGCDLARAALNKRGVPFKEVQVWNVATNEELKRVSGAAEVPTLLVGRTPVRGFEANDFDALLDSAGYPKAGAMPARKQDAPKAPEGYVSPGSVKPPTAQPVGAAPQPKAGPYDSSGLQGAPPKPGQYDPSGLQGTPPKPGQYGVPGETK